MKLKHISWVINFACLWLPFFFVRGLDLYEYWWELPYVITCVLVFVWSLVLTIYSHEKDV